VGITIALSGVFHTVHAQSPQKFIFQKTAEDYFVEGLLYGDDILVNIELARTAFTQAIRLILITLKLTSIEVMSVKMNKKQLKTTLRRFDSILTMPRHTCDAVKLVMP
jgi:predicted methyltransferase